MFQLNKLMELSFRQFIEQMLPSGVGVSSPGQIPNWNNLAYELGIEPEDLQKQVFVGAWIGPSRGALSNLRAFTVKAVNRNGEEIKGLQVDFLPTTKMGTKGLRDLVRGPHRKWKVVPKGVRATKRIPQYVDFDWFNKVIFQDKGSTPMGGAAPSTLPGMGGMPQLPIS